MKVGKRGTKAEALFKAYFSRRSIAPLSTRLGIFINSHSAVPKQNYLVILLFHSYH
jgi:hypothetical protein